jgi:hypothetical protein
MQPQDEVASVLKRYLQVEEATVKAIAADLESTSDLGHAKSAAKAKILEKLEVHAQADALIDGLIARYREDLYFVCRRLAEDDLQSGIITRAHVLQAQAFITHRRKSYDWGDGLLAVGGLLAGAAIPNVLDLFTSAHANPHPVLVIAGLFGALLLGMGIVAKAKG